MTHRTGMRGGLDIRPVTWQLSGVQSHLSLMDTGEQRNLAKGGIDQ